MSLADAGITAWNTKFNYDTIRPLTIIRDPVGVANPGVQADPSWQPLITTPNFPEYVSGHSTFSAAAATVLDAFFGAKVGFTSTEVTLPGVVRSFTSFDQAALEAGLSRIYGGIHFSFSNTDGQAAGKAVANYVLNTFDVSQDTTPPRVTLDNVLPSGASKTNITVTGQATDNLSGVQLLEVQVDQGTYAPLAFDAATGKFAFTTSLALTGSADGAHAINFRATDAAGNVAAPVPFHFTLGTKAPTLTLTSPADGGPLAAGATLTGTAVTSGPALVALSYAFDGGTSMPVGFNTTDDQVGRIANPSHGSFSQALSKLAAGPHALTVSAQDAAGNTAARTLNLTLSARIPLTVVSITPMDGANDVGVTFRPKVTFSRAIDPATLTSSNFYATDTTGAKLAATIVPADDGTFAWLFFTKPLPGASAIRLTLDGATIKAADGSLLDAAQNGTPGSKLTATFTTVSEATVPGTTLSGIIADPGPDLKPMTRDDIRPGPDGVFGTADDVYLLPVAGVRVFILGHEDQAVTTDANGAFSFSSVPVGDVKLDIDGRTATNAPAGVYFPEMVMDLTIHPAVANTVMGTMGTRQEQAANATNLGVYLPRLRTTLLRNVTNTAVTHLGVDAVSAPNLTPQQRQLLTIDVQPNSLIGPDGQKLASGQVGFSTVPPELVRDMLPVGVMQLATTLTIQAPGVAAFSTPLKVTFPNVYGAAPGSKLEVYSFNHTTGLLEITGTATVSADGTYATTDPDSGITHPGWQGLTPPGGPGGGGPAPPATITVPTTVVIDDAPVALPLISGEAGSFPKLTWKAPPAGNNPKHYLKVTIDIDGPFLKFMKKTGSLPLVKTQTFILVEGSNKVKTLEAKAKTYAQMFGLKGFQNLTRDQLYGAKITIKEESGDLVHGASQIETKTYFQYRWVDVVDADQAGKQAGTRTGTTAVFFRTLADGPGGFVRTKNVDLHVPASVNTTFEGLSGPGSEFQYLVSLPEMSASMAA